MTDPVGVSQDPRRVMLVGDEPDTVAKLLDLADRYALDAYSAQSFFKACQSQARARLESAIRAALEAQP